MSAPVLQCVQKIACVNQMDQCAPLYALGKEKRNAITVFHISYKLDND